MNHEQLLKQIRRLKKKYKKKKFKIQSNENNQNNAYATDGTESTSGSVNEQGLTPTQDEDVKNIQKQITEAEMNPDEYVSCSIQ